MTKLSFLLLFHFAFSQQNNSSVLWVKRSYEAEDLGIDLTTAEFCSNSTKGSNATSNQQRETVAKFDRSEIANLGIAPEAFAGYSEIRIIVDEVCGQWPRIYWIDSAETAGQVGFDPDNPLCEPFKLDSNRTTSVSLGNEVRFNITSENLTGAFEKQFKTKLNITSVDGDMILFIDSEATADLVYGNGSPELWDRYQTVAFNLNTICVTPKAIEKEDIVETEENVGIETDTLKVNSTDLADQLRNDTAIENILQKAYTGQTLSESYVLPLLKEQKYDPFSAPIFLEGQIVVVKFSLHLESLSDFDESAMEYQASIFLRMAWRDARFNSNYSKPIQIQQLENLKKVWLPDPCFSNAVHSDFHEVSFRNFLIIIHPTGEVLYETRIQLTVSCNLILCKFPHDDQYCGIKIKSFAYPVEQVRFEWFENKTDAFSKNPDIQLPQLYIDKLTPVTCNGSTDYGNFSCLKALMHMKRDSSFYVSSTYLPTTLALMFSWVGVWVPDELMECRLGIAITVLLTLSTEAAGSRENLPRVSYLTAYDIWFGAIYVMLFFTFIETVIALLLNERSEQLKKMALSSKFKETELMKEEILDKSEWYRRTSNTFDQTSRILYPVCFVIFIMVYFFEITQGDNDKCTESTFK